MDLQTLFDNIHGSFSIPRASPRTFYLLILTLILPFSLAFLALSVFTFDLFLLRPFKSATSHGGAGEWPFPLLFLHSVYLLLLSTFSLLPTAAVTFTFASIYAGKPISFRSTLSAVPPILSRLLRTFFWVFPLMLFSNLAFAFSVLALSHAVTDSVLVVTLSFILLSLSFLAAHSCIASLWQLASVITVLEPVCGLAAMRKSRELLRGSVQETVMLVLRNLGWAFKYFVSRGAVGLSGAMWVKVVLGLLLLPELLQFLFEGFLAPSVFYIVFKGYHNEGIDKNALSDHLGGYVGDQVPLYSSTKIRSL